MLEDTLEPPNDLVSFQTSVSTQVVPESQDVKLQIAPATRKIGIINYLASALFI